MDGVSTRVSPGLAAGLTEAPRTASSSRIWPALWIAGLVTLSTGIRMAAAHAIKAPSIFPDELIYTDLARSFADSGSFVVGGAPFSPWSYGVLYPVLLSPAFAAVHDVTAVYAVVKFVNCLLVSLAAVPAYLLARRLLERQDAVFFSAVALVVPSLVYSSHVMTESLAYPLFLWAILSIQRVVESPSARRQVEALAVIALAILTRAEMVVLLPTLVAAIVVTGALAPHPREAGQKRNCLRWIAAFRTTWSLLAGAVLLGAIGLALRSASLLGGHSAQAGHLRFAAMPRSLVGHLAEMDLASGILPLAALVLLALVIRELQRSTQIFVAITVSVTTCLLLLAMTFSAQTTLRPRIYERYVFYAVPLLVLALFAWIKHGLPSPRSGRAWVMATALLPLAIPFQDVLLSRQGGVSTSTVGLIPWLLLRVAFDSVVPVYAVTVVLGVGLGALLLLSSSRNARRLRLTVIAIFAVTALLVQATHFALASRAARLGAGSTPAWVDRVVGEHARVAAIWSGTAAGGWHSGFPIWENEFFNRSVTTVYTVRGAFPGQPTGAAVQLRGTTATVAGRPLTPRYVLADTKTEIVGTLLAQDRKTGMTLYRVRQPLRLRLVR
jgi:hypothetical protein